MRFKLVLGLLLIGGGAATLLGASASLLRGLDAQPLTVNVYPGGDIQEALERVARCPAKGTVRVHAGTYRPKAPGQAFLYFNRRHDGIVLEGVGDVTITGANPDKADPAAPSYPSVVNHVVYFGEGTSPRTCL